MTRKSGLAQACGSFILWKETGVIAPILGYCSTTQTYIIHREGPSDSRAGGFLKMIAGNYPGIVLMIPHRPRLKI